MCKRDSLKEIQRSLGFAGGEIDGRITPEFDRRMTQLREDVAFEWDQQEKANRPDYYEHHRSD